MKRFFSIFLTYLIGLTSVPAIVNAQQPSKPITFSQPELDQMLAPIALYPDSLLSQVLMATTYPLEVVQAARFIKQNSSLNGDALAQAMAGEPWDPSVKALAQFPSVLTMMDDQLAWTQKLGDAFLAQQDAVMDTVQSLRAKAQAAGALRNTQQQQVVTQDGAIDIEPYAPDVINVPYYNPAVVYGGWWWPDYPPMVWVPTLAYQPAYYDNAIADGIAFGIGVVIINTIFNNCRPDWRRHHLVHYGSAGMQRPSGTGVIWTHNPGHRLGVAYRDVGTRNRFQPTSSNNVNRDAYRGHVSIASPAPPSAIHLPRPGEQLPPSSTRLPSLGAQVRPADVRSPLPPRPVMRSPIEPVHPFIPAGPASVIQSHSERGQASREGSNSRPAPQGQQRLPSH